MVGNCLKTGFNQGMAADWNTAEIQTICESFPSCSSSDICSLLPSRTLAAIRSKAKALGLKRDAKVIITDADTTTKAYLAGIFDGEGTVGIMRHRPHAGGRNFSYVLQIQIANTDRRIIDYLNAVLHGSGSVKKSNERRPNQRDCYFWMCACQRAAAFLRMIRPFSVIKQDQIDVALAFAGRVKPGSIALTSQEVGIRDEYRNKLMAMKGRIHGTG